MTLLFFDFHPVIDRSDTFGDVLKSAVFYGLFHYWHKLVLVGYFLLSFTRLPLLFPRKYLAHSLVISFLLMSLLAFIEYSFSTGHLSDALMQMAYHFVFLCSVVILFFCIPWLKQLLLRRQFSSKFLSISEKERALFLAFIFVSSFAVGHLSYIPVVVITIFYGFYLYRKAEQLQTTIVKFQLKNLVPLVILSGIMLLFSFVKVSTVVCNTPFLKKCFTCYTY